MKTILKHKSKILIVSAIFIIVVILLWLIYLNKQKTENFDKDSITYTKEDFTIESMREKKYIGSEIKTEKLLKEETGFKSYLVSYLSDKLKIYALMNVPNLPQPKNGFPTIVLNHGYEPPKSYSTVNSYKEFTDFYANEGFLVIKPDYRGNGNSQGKPEGEYFPPAYAYDVLNLLEALKNYPLVDKDHIGLWGHSMGGNIVLRTLVVSSNIKAAVIVSGGVSSMEDLVNDWNRRQKTNPQRYATNSGVSKMAQILGDPKDNPQLWGKISTINYVSDVQSPIQLHHGQKDELVMPEFSKVLKNALEQANKKVEYYLYENGDHYFTGPERKLLLDRTLVFFNSYLKVK